MDDLYSRFSRLKVDQGSSVSTTTRRNVIDILIKAVATYSFDGYHGVRLEPCGSLISGLASDDSDVDLGVYGRRCGQDERTLDKWQQADLLRAVVAALKRLGLINPSSVIDVLHARVPIIKFTTREGNVPCDLSIARLDSVFKTRFMKALTTVDGRLRQLYHTVKAWARRNDINDASKGTLNSWSLMQMVIFHLQQQQPPILPPLHKLLGSSSTAAGSSQRPRLHSSHDVDTIMATVELTCAALATTNRMPHARNHATTRQLYTSFMTRYTTLLPQLQSSSQCLSTWHGRVVSSYSFPTRYSLRIEDPFDPSENTARAVNGGDPLVPSARKLPSIMWALQHG